MCKNKSIDLTSLHFIGYSVGVYPNMVVVRVPQYTNLREFIQNNISYNRTSLNTFMIIESNNYFFIGVINKEDMSMKDENQLIDDSNHDMTETPELYVNILSEINPVNLHLVRQMQHFPVIHSRVYIASEYLIDKFINEVSKDVNNLNTNKTTNDKNDHKKNIKPIAMTKQFATLAQNSKVSVNLSFNTLFGRHLGIVGSTGSGKSYTASKLIYNVAKASNTKNRYPIILLDPTGEYRTLVNSIQNDGKNVTQFTIGDDTRIPYYDLNDNELYKLINPSPGIQFPKLKASIDDLKYVSLGHLDHVNNNVVEFANKINDSTEVKDIKDKIQSTVYGDNSNKGKGYNFSKLPLQMHQECYRFSSSKAYISERDWSYCATLADRINRVVDDPFESKYFCNAPKNYVKKSKNDSTPNENSKEFQKELSSYDELDKHDIVYIDLSHVTLADSIAEIIGDYIARKLLTTFIQYTHEYNKKKKDYEDKGETLAPRYPAILFLDEAHNFIKKDKKDDDYHLHYFDLIAKEGRKYGLLMTIITQSPNDLSRDVLTQFGTFIIHHLSNDIEKQTIAGALPYNSDLDKYMSTLNTGEAIISSNNMYNPLLVRIKKIKDSKYCPRSDTPKF